MLADEEEAELDSRLADLHRYPFQLDSSQWQRLRDLARAGDRRGQLALLRHLVPGSVPPGDSRRVAPASADTADRLARLEQRLSAAERRIHELERGLAPSGTTGLAPDDEDQPMT